MSKQTDLLSNYARRLMLVTRNFALIGFCMTCAPLVACTYGVRHDHSTQEKSVDAVAMLSDLDSYDGAYVRMDLCVNVTIHDITLLQCGERKPQINFKAGQGKASDKAYSRLVKYAHNNMGKRPEELPVTIEGVYQRSYKGSETQHTIFLTKFSVRNNGVPEILSLNQSENGV